MRWPPRRAMRAKLRRCAHQRAARLAGSVAIHHHCTRQSVPRRLQSRGNLRSGRRRWTSAGMTLVATGAERLRSRSTERGGARWRCYVAPMDTPMHWRGCPRTTTTEPDALLVLHLHTAPDGLADRLDGIAASLGRHGVCACEVSVDRGDDVLLTLALTGARPETHWRHARDAEHCIRAALPGSVVRRRALGACAERSRLLAEAA